MLKTKPIADNHSSPDLGALLRQRRKELGLTLSAVALKAGVTTGFVSQVERNITSPSLVTLTALTETLDAHISDFFAPPPKPGETSRAKMREMYSSPGDGFAFERLSTSFPGSTLNGLLMHLPPGLASEEMRHDGEEFYYILKGAITIVVEGARSVLSAGDSIHFNSGRRHSVTNETNDTVTVLIVNTMEVFGEDRIFGEDGIVAADGAEGHLHD